MTTGQNITRHSHHFHSHQSRFTPALHPYEFVLMLGDNIRGNARAEGAHRRIFCLGRSLGSLRSHGNVPVLAENLVRHAAQAEGDGDGDGDGKGEGE